MKPSESNLAQEESERPPSSSLKRKVVNSTVKKFEEMEESSSNSDLDRVDERIGSGTTEENLLSISSPSELRQRLPFEPEEIIREEDPNDEELHSPGIKPPKILSKSQD
jgi:hypothetical protein